VRAVNYSTKAARRERPKMVLLADIVVTMSRPWPRPPRRSCGSRMRAMPRVSSPSVPRRAGGSGRPGTHRGDRRAHQCFQDNEDVVIPLARLAEYAEGIERINIEHSIQNKLAIIDAVRDYVATLASCPAYRPDTENAEEADAILSGKERAALDLLDRAQARWQKLLAALDEPAESQCTLLGDSVAARIRPATAYCICCCARTCASPIAPRLSAR